MNAKPPSVTAWFSVLAVVCALTLVAALSSVAQAANPSAGWSIQSVARPTVFSAADNVPCPGEPFRCDGYELLIANVGGLPTEGTVTITDTLPPLVRLATAGPSSEVFSPTETREEWELTNNSAERVKCDEPAPGTGVVVCVYGEAGERLPPGGAFAVRIPVEVASEVENEVALNRATVQGGGAASVSTGEPGTAPNPIDAPQPGFSLQDFYLRAYRADGAIDTQAGDHPNQVTTGFDIASILAPGLSQGESGAPKTFPAHDLKDVIVDLPVGFVGDPQAAGTCSALGIANQHEEFEFGQTLTACPVAASLGSVVIDTSPPYSGFISTYRKRGGTTALYNMVPAAGYPAEFGFSFYNNIEPTFATLIHTPAGYRLRVVVPGIIRGLGVKGVSLTLFGDPNTQNQSGNQPQAFFTNPTACSDKPLTATVQADSWDEPGHWVSKEVTAYPKVTGCEALRFNPSFEVKPETTQADTPSSYRFDLHVPQSPNAAPNLATPDLKDAKVTLPAGLSVSPSSAEGLAGCPATGPNGINLGSDNIGPEGRDEGDPEATELGAGHPGGNGSPYDDGLYHTAPGHCPLASTLGTVEVSTPVLPEPLKGHVYLGTPDCSPCSEADAQNGRLLKLYIEVEGSGVIAKLPGTVSIDPASGRLVGSFKQSPQLPFEDLKLNFKSGPRAALANPATCGTYTTTTDLVPWSSPQTPDATPSSSFNVSSGPNGQPCNSPLPFKPSAQGGSLTPLAGAKSPFSLALKREDGNQRLSRINATLPPGETAILKGVGQCSDAALAAAAAKGGAAEQANPSCPASSLVGTATVGAGPGSHPFHIAGRVYLTGPYKGAPLGLAVITPALAGPFDLGTVVVRSALHVDPETAQITVKSDPIPTIRDGIPLDVRSIAVDIARNRFTLNPTSCDPMSITATATSVLNQAAPLSSPFQVGACNALPFKPKLKISLKGATRRAGHPALRATLTAKPGEANIASAQVTLPHSAFLDQAHIGTVCTRVQFSAHACPAASVYGKAIAYTPLLDKPLSGPVYLRSSSNKLPDLVADLGGQIEVVLDGKVDTGKGGGIRNTFQVVPDAPVSKFALSMKGGSKGLLVNSENLCSPKAKTHAVSNFTAQNGKVYDTTPAVTNSCKVKTKKHGAHR